MNHEDLPFQTFTDGRRRTNGRSDAEIEMRGRLLERSPNGALRLSKPLFLYHFLSGECYFEIRNSPALMRKRSSD